MDIFVSGIGGLGLVGMKNKIVSLLETRYAKVYSSESRGIAQRRGSVSSIVRAGDKLLTPKIYSDKVDLVIALEALEVLRQPNLIKPGTVCLLSDFQLRNFGGSQRDFDYPSIDELIYSLNSLGAKVVLVPFSEFMSTKQILNVHVSSAMLGVFAQLFEFNIDDLQFKFPELFKDTRNRESISWGYELFDFKATKESEDLEEIVAA